MAYQNQQRDDSQQPNQREEGRQENSGNRTATSSSLVNREDESISTADDTSLGKGSKMNVHKDEKESSDHYDKGRP